MRISVRINNGLMILKRCLKQKQVYYAVHNFRELDGSLYDLINDRNPNVSLNLTFRLRGDNVLCD